MRVFYDCEIIRAIPPKDGQQRLGYQYCAGWHDFENMGLACCCVITEHGDARVFGESNLDGFQEMVNYATELVTYNGISFDDKLLAANGIIIPPAKQVDLKVVIEKSAGRRYKLNDLTRRNCNAKKSGDGAEAPFMWQDGKHIEVIDYCLNDVGIMVKLWRKMYFDGHVYCPYLGGIIKTTQREFKLAKN